MLLRANAKESARYFKVQQENARKHNRNCVFWNQAEAWGQIVRYLGSKTEVRAESRSGLDKMDQSCGVKSNELVCWSVVDILKCMHGQDFTSAYSNAIKGCGSQQKRRLVHYPDGVLLFLLLYLCLDLLRAKKTALSMSEPIARQENEPLLTASESSTLRTHVDALIKVLESHSRSWTILSPLHKLLEGRLALLDARSKGTAAAQIFAIGLSNATKNGNRFAEMLLKCYQPERAVEARSDLVKVKLGILARMMDDSGGLSSPSPDGSSPLGSPLIIQTTSSGGSRGGDGLDSPGLFSPAMSLQSGGAMSPVVDDAPLERTDSSRSLISL
jgi:hypothetical protein